MESKRDEIRKGPWKQEEDQVLINHVKKYGPRDWSSIRSKGLLQRTGKSCRLRWVNKLRPNLKNGCKFSLEEERVVIELQAQFGNKWARIATNLPGRTDNDVKNFWSSRQKRLARILQNSNTPSSSKSHKKSVSGLDIGPLQSSSKGKELTMRNDCCCSLSNIDNNYDLIKMVPLPDLVNSKLLQFEEQNHIDASSHQISFPQVVQQTEQDNMSFSPGSQEYLSRFTDPYYFDVFGAVDESIELPGMEQSSFLKPASSSGDGVKDGGENPDVFFDDFPADMFDQIEPLPSPSDW